MFLTAEDFGITITITTSDLALPTRGACVPRSLARFSGPESLIHTRSLADFITTTSGFRFSVHTGNADIISSPCHVRS
jgi:hypothetical protein